MIGGELDLISLQDVGAISVKGALVSPFINAHQNESGPFVFVA